MPYNFDNTMYGTPNYEGTYAQHLQQSQNPLSLGQVVSMVRSLGDRLGQGGGISSSAMGQHAERYDVPSTMQMPTQFMQNMVSGQVSYPRAWLRNQQATKHVPISANPISDTLHKAPDALYNVIPPTPGIVDPVKSVQQSGSANLQPVGTPASSGGSSGVTGGGSAASSGGATPGGGFPSTLPSLRPSTMTPSPQTTPQTGASSGQTGGSPGRMAQSAGRAALAGRTSHGWRPGF